MSYAISDLENDLSGIFHGTTLDSIINEFGIYNRAAKQLLLDCDPIETKRIATLAQVFNTVYDYSVPTDLKGQKVIDIRPQAGRQPGEAWEQTYARRFDLQKYLNTNNAFNIQHNTGVKSLRLEAPTLPIPLVLSDTGDVSVWTGGSTAVNLTLDQTFNVAGSGAIQYDQTLNGYIEGTITALDLSTHKNISTLFAWIYMPTVLTSITLTWGDSSSANWYSTQTTKQDGTAFSVGWNLLSFPWQTATQVGSPTSSPTYLKVTTTGGAMTGLKVDNIQSILGEYLEMVYYSKYLFSRAGTWVETVTDKATDFTTTINLDTDSYNLFLNLVAYLGSQQLQGYSALHDESFFWNEYQRGLKRYTGIYKSEVLLAGEQYYEIPHKGYRGFGIKMWR